MRKSQTVRRSFHAIFLTGFLLSGCSLLTQTPSPQPLSCPPCAATSVPAAAAVPAKPLQAAQWSDLPGWADDDPAAAWPAFLLSCRALAARPHGTDWSSVCEAARVLPSPDGTAIRNFLESRLRPYRLTQADGSSNGLITSYYEPLLRGSRTRTAKYAQPVLGVPPDLLSIDLSEALPDLKNMRLRGRLVGNRVVPYYSRAEIVARGQEKLFPDKVLLWVDDAIEFFFLQVQGSGRVQLSDGSTVRLGYADQNGYPYKSIGRVLIERGELSADQASMQGIQAWARANSARLNELLNSNPSYVFFRQTPMHGKSDEGPVGALGVPLSAGRSIAVDPAYVPLGAPVFLATTQPGSSDPLRRLVLAQDTGGAIRGVVRADLFWGFGAEAGTQAGRMRQQGEMWLLWPSGSEPRP